MRCCALSNKPHFSVGLFRMPLALRWLTQCSPEDFLYMFSCKTIETSCLKRTLSYNSMILIGQEFKVHVSVWRLFMKVTTEFCCSLRGEHIYRLDLYPKSSARDPAFHVSVSLGFTAVLIHSKSLCMVMLSLSNSLISVT